MSDKLVKYGSIEKAVKEPDLTDPKEWVPLNVEAKNEYEELRKKFDVVNFEYNRLSNYWMGFIAAHRPTQRELDLFEKRGQLIFSLGSRLLKIHMNPAWWARLFMWIFVKLVGND